MNRDIINTYLQEVEDICNSISVDDITSFIGIIKQIKERYGRLFFMGVGGSAANASHAVNDFRKILNIESYAISDNVAELTARINDVGWDTCYADWLKVSRISHRDGVVVFSVGGGSQDTSFNLVRAIMTAKIAGAKVLSIVSRDGGFCKSNSDACVLIPVVNIDRITPHAEEWQSVVWHLVVDLLQSSYNTET